MKVRTRFAPSPTGDLHIGGARTALFNFLFARGAGGAFVLRIDDTDAERSQAGYERNLTEDLLWLGIEWDEGPDRGLPVPYRQSERGVFYGEVLETLREMGAVYPCFCTEERLDTLRKETLARGEAPRYDGLCRRLPPGEAERRMEAGERPCWRFAMPERPVRFRDAVRGDLSFTPEEMGDFVVARSGGHPTYLFTSVVDDRLMEISHIIRGDEHVPNTARQQAIFERLGWVPPVYAHIPMILSSDRQKLSKRSGSTPIRRFRKEGYLPEALAVYLSSLSWAPSVPLSSLFASAGDGGFLAEAAPLFSLDRVSASSPVHDEAHLKYWQKEAMRKRGGGVILDELREADPRFGAFDATALRRLAEDLLEEYCTLPLLREALGFLPERPPRLPPEPWTPEAVRALRQVDPWNEEGVNRALRSFMEERGLKGKDFFHPLRRVLTGRDKGAALPLVMSVLGREETLTRLALKP